MNRLVEDLRCARRALFRRPGLTLAAVVTLALSIGANTVIFTVVESVVIHPLPYRDANRLVYLSEAFQHNGSWVTMPPNGESIRTWQEQAGSFERIEIYRNPSFQLLEAGESFVLPGARISPGLFALFGVEPILGRTFTAEESRGVHRVAILSHDVWRGRFGADPEILDRRILLGGEEHTIVGVLPSKARYIVPAREIRIWVPLNLDNALSTKAPYWTVARLRDGVSVAAAQAELDTINARMPAESTALGGINKGGIKASVRTVRDETRHSWPPILIFQVAVAFVLLIACSNVAHLLLAQGEIRCHEFAVRRVLGAGRGRLLRQLLTESLVLSAIGGTAGLALAPLGLAALTARLPPQLSHLEHLAVNPFVFAVAIGITLATGILFGLPPALRSSSPALEESLKQGSSRSGAPRRALLRQALVVTKVALAFTLLLGAGLMTLEIHRLQTADKGFEHRNLLAVDVSLSREFPETSLRNQFAGELLESLRTNTSAAFESVTLALGVPPNSRNGHVVQLRPEDDPELMQVAWSMPGYFETLGIPLLDGRDFTDEDRDGSPPVVIIPRAVADHYWPSEDAVGQRLQLGPDLGEKYVVGVVGDISHTSLSSAEDSKRLYFPYRQMPDESRRNSSLTLAVRFTGDSSAPMSEIRARVEALDPEAYIAASTVEERMAQLFVPARFNMFLVTLFASVAVVMAAVGIYGVVAFSVNRRTWETGVRMALGARGGDIFRHVIAKAMVPVAVGVLAGAAASFALVRVLGSRLPGLPGWDLGVALLVVSLVAGVAFGAIGLPARRAAKLEPTEALRYE